MGRVQGFSKEGAGDMKAVGLLPTGHYPTIGNLLMPVNSISLFKTLFFLPCVPGQMIFFGYVRFAVIFVSIFFFSWPFKLAELYIYLQPNFILL